MSTRKPPAPTSRDHPLRQLLDAVAYSGEMPPDDEIDALSTDDRIRKVVRDACADVVTAREHGRGHGREMAAELSAEVGQAVTDTAPATEDDDTDDPRALAAKIAPPWETTTGARVATDDDSPRALAAKIERN